MISEPLYYTIARISERVNQNDNEKRLLISFRNAGNLTSEQMEELENLFSQSMDLYLKAKGLKK